MEAPNAVLVLLEARVLRFRAWSAAQGVAAEGVVAEGEAEVDDDGQVEAYNYVSHGKSRGSECDRRILEVEFGTKLTYFMPPYILYHSISNQRKQYCYARLSGAKNEHNDKLGNEGSKVL